MRYATANLLIESLFSTNFWRKEWGTATWKWVFTYRNRFCFSQNWDDKDENEKGRRDENIFLSTGMWCEWWDNNQKNDIFSFSSDLTNYVAVDLVTQLKTWNFRDFPNHNHDWRSHRKTGFDWTEIVVIAHPSIILTIISSNHIRSVKPTISNPLHRYEIFTIRRKEIIHYESFYRWFNCCLCLSIYTYDSTPKLEQLILNSYTNLRSFSSRKTI